MPIQPLVKSKMVLINRNLAEENAHILGIYIHTNYMPNTRQDVTHTEHVIASESVYTRTHVPSVDITPPALDPVLLSFSISNTSTMFVRLLRSFPPSY